MSLSTAVATPISPALPAPGPVTPATVQAWQTHRDEAAARLAACLPPTAVRDRAQAYVDGLRSDAPRKNGGQRAEINGDATPYAMPHLLGRALGSENAVGAGLYAYVAAHLGDAAGGAILDETGFRKKGTHSAGVARPYSGTAGQIANGQVGVFRAYAGSPRPRGRVGMLSGILPYPTRLRTSPSLKPRGGPAHYTDFVPFGPARAISPQGETVPTFAPTKCLADV